MANSGQHRNCILGIGRRVATVALGFAIVFALTVIAAQSAHAQTYTDLHNFAGTDGGNPYDGLTIDGAGNLYGAASSGGAGFGTVYKLTHKGSGFTFNPLYSFTGGSDGANPSARPIFGTNGTLYGTTALGGVVSGCIEGNGCGTIYNLRPQARVCKTALCPWTESVLYSFTGGNDGSVPNGLIFDQGNIYGTTENYQESPGYGTVFELVPSNGGWAQSTLYSFTGGNDGAYPTAGVAIDQAGNLYGTADNNGQYGYGTVYQLTRSGSGWIEKTLYEFTGGNDGGYPAAGLIFDPSGNLYGATVKGGSGGGVVFELSPSNGGWTFSSLYALPGDFGPARSLIMDSAGDLYGTTVGFTNDGAVFELTPSNGTWVYKDLHDFGGGDGSHPRSNVVFDRKGNLYGTASEGGANGLGVVWEITP